MERILKKKKRKWPKILGIILLLLLLSIGGFTYYVWYSFSKTLDTIHTESNRESPLREETLNLSDAEPFSVLLLGVDERDGDSGRSDSMIILTVNAKKNQVDMLSIPRDTRTEIVGHGTTDKINHAYAFGGIEMAMDTVENLLQIPVDHYIEVNMESFEDIVNAVGGVTVENDLDFTYQGVHFPIGTITLNGEDALTYSRMRKDDPNGDFGRQERQRKIIEAVIKKGANFTTLTNFQSIFNSIAENIETTLSYSDLMTIQKQYRLAVNNIEQLTLEGTGTKIDGIYYYLVSDESLSSVQSKLKEQLEL